LQSLPGFGYMSRTAVHSRRLDIGALPDIPYDEQVEPEEVDEATVNPSPAVGEALNAQHFVVYSATFGAPVFYFTVHDPSMWITTLRSIS
jgi:hypothetical protein